MKRIIIHFPFKINRGRAAASQLRPIRIIETFQTMGYNVFLVEGYGQERKRKIKEIEALIKSGANFEFLYSECSTIPTQLTEKHHYPTYPFLDFSFFQFCKQHGIKIGLFYRDIYWCFPENNKGIIRKVMKVFFKYDLHEYNKYVSALFVPSFEMVSHIPAKLTMPVYELYPGCEKKSVEQQSLHSDCIHILYVGGIGHHYDVSMMLDVIKDIPNISLTICCREDDWNKVKDEYHPFLRGNVKVVHSSGKELEHLYADADLFCLFVRPDKYREFAVPFKLFETIGYVCPVIASEGTWVAKFVKEHGLGFTCQYEREALSGMLSKLSNHPDVIKKAKTTVANNIGENTWEARCLKIASILTK